MSENAGSRFLVFKKLVRYILPYKGLFVASLLAIVFLAVASSLRPHLIGEMVNKYIVSSKNPHQLLIWSLVVLGILILEQVLQFVSSYVSNLLAQSIIRDLRKKVFKHLLYFRMRYFDQTPVGSLVTRVVSDIEAITEVFSSGLMDILGDMIVLVAVLFWMFSTNWQLALMTIVPIPLLIVATRIFARSMRKSFQLERTQVNKLNTFVQERLTGMSIVQLFNREQREYASFVEINKGHRQAHINAVWATSIFFPVVELLSSLSIALLLVWGAVHAIGATNGQVKLMFGEIISFTLWVNMLFRPIRQLADKFNILQRGTVRAERVFEVLDMKDDIQRNGTDKKSTMNAPIVFKDVWFAYKDEDWVLKGIGLTIKPGETVAFVGATGAGKTTIVNLLGRFYEYQKGSINIGPVALEDFDLDYLRKNIAIVLQDVFLFSDTVFKNITLGDPSISREQVIEAARAVGAHDFISNLPGGYDYQVGERGGVLSVGQRQLLAFIRAYVYNPQLLILDEATSSVDHQAEELIQQATLQLTKGRTSIVIAHRLSTIQQADKIIVMDKGELVEVGNHHELIKENGYYKRLYDLQFKEE
jgi:ATP-binding cassette subfamily B multidrug efflux pump